MRYLTKKRQGLQHCAEAVDALAATAPELLINRIVRRIVVIDHEQHVREAVIYEFDSAREARRKIREVFSVQSVGGRISGR